MQPTDHGKEALTESSPPPKTESACDQAQRQHRSENSNPPEVHRQWRHDRANAKGNENSARREHNRVVPPTSWLVSVTELIAHLGHHCPVVVQPVAIALPQYCLVCRT